LQFEFIDVAYNSAAESITLLKKTHAVLPLNKSEKNISYRPTANSMKSLNGDGHTLGKERKR
jgi:beta-glucosidase